MSTAPNAVAAVDVRNVTSLPISVQPDYVNPNVTIPTAIGYNDTFNPVGVDKVPVYNTTTTNITTTSGNSNTSRTNFISHHNHHRLQLKA